MTKQEEIEERLFRIINKAVRASKESGRRNTGSRKVIEDAVQEAIKYLRSKGIEFPEN